MEAARDAEPTHLTQDSKVRITSYEISFTQKSAFKMFRFKYIIVHVAHHIEIVDSCLS
jgi:hypothetical protein